MTDRTFFLQRDDLMAVFNGNPRAVRSFEQLQEKVALTDEATTAGVDATDEQAQATYITLSPNAQLPNERVLSLGTGLRFILTDGGVSILSDAPRIAGGHEVTFSVTGATNLVLPIVGVLATREWFAAQGYAAIPGPFANDAAALAGGVAVGEIYLKGTKLAARLV